MSRLADLGPELAAVPGTVSIWYGQPGGPARFSRGPDVPHYAASTMKVAVLAAVHRAVDAGRLDLVTPIAITNDFASAAPGGRLRFGCRESYDSDPAVWRHLGGSVPLGWLTERMITASSNLATNLVLERVGLAAVAEVWAAVGATGSVVARGIEDAAGAEAGLTNLVTAADLAALLGAITLGGGATALSMIASPAACQKMLDTLLAQERAEDLAAGLPPDTPVAHKNGWIMGVRHAAGVVLPAGEPPFVLVVCTSTPWAVNEPDDRACQLVARIAAAAWADRDG